MRLRASTVVPDQQQQQQQQQQPSSVLSLFWNGYLRDSNSKEREELLNDDLYPFFPKQEQ
jgi:hypothetical protein